MAFSRKINDMLDLVARDVSITAPSSWVDATDEEYVEIRDEFLIDAVKDILDRVDLPSPIGKSATLTGDGSTTVFDLPADFHRLKNGRDAVYETSPTRRRCVSIDTDDEWTVIETDGVVGVCRYFRSADYQDGASYQPALKFLANLEDGTTVDVNYMSGYWMVDSTTNTATDTFGNVNDWLLLDPDVVRLGILWRWRERRGLPFLDLYNACEAKIERYSERANRRKVISFGKSTRRRGPFDLPPPDAIYQG